MAVVHAGTKRSFHEMQSRAIISTSKPASNELIPDRSPSRHSSEALTPPNGTHAVLGSLTPTSRKVSFDSNASVLLIGVRGAGKSSLGFLAASAYSRRLIESDRAFSDGTGMNRPQYRKTHGPAEYHRRRCEILKAFLSKNDKNSVIVCSFADLESDGARLLQEFAQTHPVVYVTRDIPGMQNYIRAWPEERIKDLIRASEGLLRDCSNFEFFNLSETLDDSLTDESRVPHNRTTHGPFLTLKRTEHDFLKLLRNVLGDHDRGRSHQSAYPLSQVSVDKLDFTSAVILTVEDIVSRRLDLGKAQTGADAIRLDIGDSLHHANRGTSSKHSSFNLVSEAFAIVRRCTILPIVIGLSRSDWDSDINLASKADLIEYCLRLGPEYCTMDLSLQDSQLERILREKGRTKVIAEHNALERFSAGWQDPKCIELYQRAHRLGCDLVKITMPGGSVPDNFAIHALQQRLQTMRGDNAPKLIAYCTGQQGRTSMCFNSVLTPVIPARTNTEPDSLMAAPFVTAQERNAALFASFVYEPTRFFIYGANVSFSLSPAMHNAAYEACGMRHSYRTHSASTLDDFVTLVREHDFGGAAVVQPFKTKTIPMMDVLSPQAKAIGALNTVIPLRDESTVATVLSNNGIFRERNRTGPVKALYGDNTDWIGIRACIRRGLSPANTVRPHSTGLVCGAGGMARAAIYAMISLGVQNIIVCNRTTGNAEDLAQHYNSLIKTNGITELSPANASDTSVTALKSFDCEWPSNLRHPTMIVSCIPTQTVAGTPTNFTLPKDWLSSRTGGVVVELAYMPIVTPLVRQIQREGRKGWILMDGLDMLPEQAFAQFELFTGRRAPRGLMRSEVFKHYNEDESPPHGALNTDSPTPC